MTSLKPSKFNFTAAVDNIYAQFAAVNRGLNMHTVESFIFVGLKFRGFQISDKLVGI